jgi:hypothetical protein
MAQDAAGRLSAGNPSHFSAMEPRRFVQMQGNRQDYTGRYTNAQSENYGSSHRIKIQFEYFHIFERKAKSTRDKTATLMVAAWVALGRKNTNDVINRAAMARPIAVYTTAAGVCSPHQNSPLNGKTHP